MIDLATKITYTNLSPAKAIELAANLNAGEDEGWTYTAVHPEGSRYAYVEIRDEDGNLLGRL